MLKKLSEYVREGVWREDPAAHGLLPRMGLSLLRLVSGTFNGFVKNPCGLHAAGLTYFTILALVPVLCLLMVFAKTCGADGFAREQINVQIDAFISDLEEGAEKAAPAEAVVLPPPATAPKTVQDEAAARRVATLELAHQARAVSNDLFDRIAVFDVDTLGWVGFAMLAWTVISTLGQVETSMNAIWNVTKARPVWKRCVLYLFISLVLPLFSALALSLPVLRGVKAVLDATLGATSYTKWMGDALVALLTSRAFGFCVTLAFSALTFGFLFKVMPNRHVQTRSALEGGLVTALVFGALVKACTSAGMGIAKSSALYGSFAAVPILLAWLYMSWQVFLFGSCLTYALQCLHCRVRALPDC